jgi:hypothetical protein
MTSRRLGLGRPVIDLLRQAGLPVATMTLTGNMKWPATRMVTTCPRRTFSTPQVLPQIQQLSGGGVTRGRSAVRKLLAFQVKIAANGHDTYST